MFCILIHIIRPNEKLSDICKNFNVTKDEIISNNRHITDFDNLQGGMKIKIPFIKKETKAILEETESFVSEYYPEYKSYEANKKKSESLKKEEHKMEEEPEEKIIIEPSEVVIDEPIKEVAKIDNKPIEKNTCSCKKPLYYFQNYYGNQIPKLNPKNIRKI